MIRIDKVCSNFEREPLMNPFGFKGRYIDDLWQVAVTLESSKKFRAVGLGVQSVLWSDEKIFDRFSQAAANSMMFAITEYALLKAKELSFDSPSELLEKLIPLAYEYGRNITRTPDLRLTFILNALVPIDNAAWILYCREKNILNFDDMIPDNTRSVLSFRHEKLANIPLITYGMSLQQVVEKVNDGSFLLKIKIGSDPGGDGSPEKMLEWDKQRLTNIHNAVKDRETKYTDCGHVSYYLDANGRYDSKERLMSFLDHAESIGALDRIVMLEEPFPEEYKESVYDIPVTLAADESAHTDKDVIERIGLGYKAVALKPIAKTMSMSLKIAKIAHEKGIPCFCADLTVNPVMVDWNKNIAARLAPLPGIKVGVLESNGYQNYRRWNEMKSFHPNCEASWINFENGMFVLDESFYKHSGGIFETSQHYASLVCRKDE